MGRRKKDTFQPSKYQQAIFDFVKKGSGNAVVEASAGSGKTFTLIKSLDYIGKRKKILFTAFNKDIVTELQEKIGERDNIDIKTLHSLGLSMIYRNLRGKGYKLEINGFKYQAYFKQNFKELVDVDELKDYPKSDREQYTENIKSLIDLSRTSLCGNEKEIRQLAEKYGYRIIFDEPSVVLKIMEWGKTNLDKIDYTDMVWLPNVLKMSPYGLSYDWIFVDEAQDENASQRDLILRCNKLGTRMLICGDEKQQLYVFSGGDSESFNEFKNLPNTISLPLSISYRCADKIVDFASRYSNNIERNDDGRIGEIQYEVPLTHVQDGDMVVCRNNAPLSKLYTMLLKENKKAYIRGKDIGTNLIKYIDSFGQTLINQDLSSDGLFVRMYDELFRVRDNVASKNNIDEKSAIESPQVQYLIDQINTIEALSDGINSVSDLKDSIEKIFSDDNRGGISLSTIHKAKGLESDRVFIVCPSLMPSKLAKLPWELTQEKNLMYVAYTRAKNYLGFLSEDGFDNMNTFNIEKEDVKFRHIEFLVNKILKKEKKLITNEANIKYIVDTARKDIGQQKRIITLDKATTISANTFSGIGTIMKAPKKRRR